MASQHSLGPSPQSELGSSPLVAVDEEALGALVVEAGCWVADAIWREAGQDKSVEGSQEVMVRRCSCDHGREHQAEDSALQNWIEYGPYLLPLVEVAANSLVGADDVLRMTNFEVADFEVAEAVSKVRWAALLVHRLFEDLMK